MRLPGPVLVVGIWLLASGCRKRVDAPATAFESVTPAQPVDATLDSAPPCCAPASRPSATPNRADDAQAIGEPCDWSAPLTRSRRYQFTAPHLRATIEVSAPATAACGAAVETELRTFFSMRAKSVFRDDDADDWSADINCERAYQTARFQSWRCMFEHSPVGAYQDYQVVGISALAESTGLVFVEPLDSCVGAARAKLIEAAVQAAVPPAREALQRLRQDSLLSPSTFRTTKSLTFSFTDALPHVVDGVGTVELAIGRVIAICGAGDSRTATILATGASRK
jgi:hypothetical protein